MRLRQKLDLKNRLHIAVDLDDVVLDFMGGLQEAIKTEYGISVPNFTKWEIADVLDPILGKRWWDWMRERDWLWSQFPALEGSIGGLVLLRGRGHYLEIVTSKPEWAEYAVWKWLGKWRPPVHRVTIVDLETPKIDVTDADVLIDDKVENVNQFDKDGRLGILFSRTHNRTRDDVGDSVVRAEGWVVGTPNVLSIIDMEMNGEL